MLEPSFRDRLWGEIKNLIPLFRYLILQTETHAFCLSLACAALIGFFPSCLLMLSILMKTLHWDLAYNVMLEMVQGYFLPGDRSFVIRNLDARFKLSPMGGDLSLIFWVIVGAAGVFVPLEASLNRLWRVQADRPYWKNQLVGFVLTLICGALGLFFVLLSTAMHWIIGHFPLESLRQALGLAASHLSETGFFVFSIFALYFILPNKPNNKVDAMHILPAAVLAGILVEVVRVIYFQLAPDLAATQGPFAISVTFLVLAYFETFVVLGCAFLASQRDRYPWIGFLPGKRGASAQKASR